MREKDGAVFSIAKENAPVPGCTVSKELSGGENYISVFSLAKDTVVKSIKKNIIAKNLIFNLIICFQKLYIN